MDAIAAKGSVVGVVLEWHNGEGWGVFDSPETPGGCWAHYSCIEMPVPVSDLEDGSTRLEIGSAVKVVRPGQAVDLDWESPGQDGFHYLATRVVPRCEAPAADPGRTTSPTSVGRLLR